MSELEEAYHEAMAAVGNVESSWRTVFTGATKRMNQIARSLVTNPTKGSKMEGYVERLNPTMKAKLIATYQPFRVGSVSAIEDDVHGQFRTGSSDAQVLANSRDELEQMAKEAVIAEMVANPKVWLSATLKKRMHASSKK